MSEIAKTLADELTATELAYRRQTAQYEALRERERAYRAATQAKRPVPCLLHAVAFAATEAGEYLDALLRKEPQYERSHDKNVDPADELGDLLEMILTCEVTATPAPALDEMARTRWLLTGLILQNLGHVLTWLAGSGRLDALDADNRYLLVHAFERTLALLRTHGVTAEQALGAKHTAGLEK